MKTPNSPDKSLPASGRARVSLVILWSLLVLPVAPIDAQGSNQEETTVIVGTSADLEDLVVTVAWQDSVAAEWLEIAVFDENDLQIAGQPVWPTPGERMRSTFGGFLHNLPESGFQFSATVRDAAGRDVSQRHAFRVVLECPPSMEACQWGALDGIYTNALAISEPLMTALVALEAKGSSDLLADVLEEQPDLRGPVFSLAAQLDRLDQKLGLNNECACVWFHFSTQSPKQRERKQSGLGLSPDGSFGSEQEEVKGSGATALAAGQALHFPMSHLATATGTSQQTLGLVCWKIHYWIEVAHLPLLPSPGASPRTIRFPIVEACPGSCRGEFESSAEILYRLSTRVREPAPDSNLAALASVDGFLERDDPPKKDYWKARLLWQPGDTDLERGGVIQIPTEGVFVDGNVPQMTTTLSGRAIATFRAEDGDAWSYALACFKGTRLRIKGHADCAIQPTREAELRASADGSRSDDCGESQIEPWGD